MNGSCTNLGHETRHSTDGSSLEFEHCVGPRGELWAMQEPPSAERKHKPLPDSHGLFFFCQTPLLLPELFRNRGALRPVLWMQRFVCILPSNKSGPVLFLMKSRSGVLLRERTNTNAHTGAVRSVPLRRPVSVQGNSHLSRICLIIL